ncbi:hypothetical protein BDZ90DRAFT_275646 [Jaminaea rosea]|uniref:Ribosomal protein mS38 C-terminal domain-containing protein n=1 Tax=Jaminaea rosea TaxID=1569628 RepID=A0A316UKG8_9BASI|nr:hypothetical protein BDZ90DRAFT_275646 [Jaminaea rosea]PWN25747.1 hypothetical protein BDZ90DRAFT_275646 [Jaminaea rosea]
MTLVFPDCVTIDLFHSPLEELVEGRLDDGLQRQPSLLTRHSVFGHDEIEGATTTISVSHCGRSSSSSAGNRCRFLSIVVKGRPTADDSSSIEQHQRSIPFYRYSLTTSLPISNALKFSGLSLHDAVVPVRPPPHSQISVGLQAFFSQGRPLLEHNNIFDKSHAFGGSTDASHFDAASTMAANANAMVVVLPESPDNKMAAGRSIDAEIKRKATALVERMMEMREKLEAASPEARGAMFKDMTGGASLTPVDANADMTAEQKLLSSLLASPSKDDNSSSRVKFLSFSLHLPPLRSISSSSFDSILSPSAGKPKAKTPLSLHVSIAQEQAWQAEKARAVSSALERGEDTTVAESLGPEADLVVVGEPEGARAEWGRGVASYLARFGNAYQAPPAPVASEAAANVKGLDDVTSYQVRSDERSSLEEEEDLDVEALEASSPASSPVWPLSHGSLEDVNLWLGHALVQDQTRAALEWTRVLAQMDASVNGGRTARLPSMREGLMNLRSLRAFPAGSEVRSRGLETIAVRPTQNMTIEDTKTVGEQGEDVVVQMDSTRRKRLKKMNKMKYKKLRKRQRAERQRLKK